MARPPRSYGDFRRGPLIQWSIFDNDTLIWTGMAKSYPDALKKMKEEQSNGRKPRKQREQRRKQQH